MQRSPRRAFALLSDAECNEGSTWEAVMFAAHHKLANVIAVVDLNGQQALDYTDRVLSLHPLADRWRASDFLISDRSRRAVGILRCPRLGWPKTPPAVTLPLCRNCNCPSSRTVQSI